MFPKWLQGPDDEAVGSGASGAGPSMRQEGGGDDGDDGDDGDGGGDDGDGDNNGDGDDDETPWDNL